MALIPLEIPPGLYANGTDMDGAGRWIDGNLVRWRDASLRPVGGWTQRVDTSAPTAPRAMKVWQDNSGDRWLVLGTSSKLYAVSGANVVSDITPAGFTAGIEDAAVNIGYGGGFYGVGFYGTPREDSGVYSEATTWALDTWGEYLVGCTPDDGIIYEWRLVGATPAAQVANAPVDNLSLMVTQERFLFALGAGGNPRLVQWCDREDNTLWTPAATNEAGDIELQTSGQVMLGIRARGQALILTDVDAHTATYNGPPFVYSFEKVGSACGAISRKCAAATDAGVFWMGQKGFFGFDGATVTELPCDIHDKIFSDINPAQASKVWACEQSQNGEVWWFYCSEASNEINRYAAFDYKAGYWTFGTLSRTCGEDRGVFRNPLWADSAGIVYRHEDGYNYDGAAVYAETGPISLGVGDSVMKINELIPDEKTQGEVTATLKTRFHPNDVEREYGPYTMANPTCLRVTGRQVRLRIDGAGLTPWRVGTMRVDAFAGGRR